ncbi:hypothetical protein, partial [Bacteroides heparinolyticus]|uniref:hypothetical protein n=1 Tax=Prevotella heparinolytica TaxID=28113 RepID=UPI0035A10503
HRPFSNAATLLHLHCNPFASSLQPFCILTANILQQYCINFAAMLQLLLQWHCNQFAELCSNKLQTHGLSTEAAF